MGTCLSKQDTSSHAISEKPEPLKPLHLNDFDLRRVVGKGAFGKVKVVVHKKSGLTYALKYIDKDACIERNATANVIRERKILEALNHPLVCNLRFAFQDVEYLYLVTDLMLGGDLRFHLLRKTFTESAIKHWIAELSVALSYCHERGIIHRDVKPDNILLTEDGHVKLADFNISTQIKGNNLPHSRSGSLFYMAPEVHLGQCYDFAIDYWSMGVMFFECIYGHRPFAGKTNSEVALLVCENTLVQPSVTPSVTDACQEVIAALLQKQPASRLRSVSKLQTLSFFQELDWPKLVEGLSTPIFIPGSHKNFDASWELEEILLHDSPLEARRPGTRRRSTRERTKEDDMHDLLDAFFTEFDFTKNQVSNADPLEIPGGNIMAQVVDRCSTDVIRTEPDFPIQNGAGGNTVTAQDVVTETDSSPSLCGLFRRRAKPLQQLPAGVLSFKPCARLKT